MFASDISRDCVQVLLERGADVTLWCRNDLTALMAALYFDRLDCLLPLIEAGAKQWL
jgi:hypothetical protein